MTSWTSAALGLGVAAFAGGCAGKASESGPLASCGSQCSASQLAQACSVVCSRVTSAECPAELNLCCTACPSIATTPSPCPAELAAYLDCAASAPVTCQDAGSANFPSCTAQGSALLACVLDSGTLAASVTGCTLPASECPGIPRPLNAASCSATSSGTGANQEICQDDAGNVWSSICTGSGCTCTYNGGAQCTCDMLDGGFCSSCCPGIF
jgi:hypothetical protein